jgi:hypothetical protein
MKSIGILYIAIGKYNCLWENFYTSVIQNSESKKGIRINFFVFTDKPDFFTKYPVKTVQIKDLGWPRNTMYRFKYFFESKELFKGLDSIFYFNANAEIINYSYFSNTFFYNFTDDLIAVIHPGYQNSPTSLLPFERRKHSTASVGSEFVNLRYFQGAIMGGSTSAFLKCSETISKQILEDENKGVIAIYHDESHWNSFLVKNTDLSLCVLHPGFAFPEGWSMNYDCVILMRDKERYFKQGFKRMELLRSKVIRFLFLLKEKFRG